MATIIDVSSTCGSKAGALAAAGIRTVIRYYSRDTIRPSKRLKRDEALDFTAAGLRIGIVHEGRFGDKASNFDRACGLADALYARSYGAATIGQPAGSVIYFGVDFDATAAEIRDQIIPYFQGVVDAFARHTGEPDYVIGVYGSGATCTALLDAGLARRAWLAQATGWAGYAKFLASERWTLSQAMPTTIAGVSCDPNTAGDGKEVGDFWLTLAPPAVLAPATPVGASLRVNARSGLRLRAGPGVEFDSSVTLPFNTRVHPLKTIGGWTAVDLQGDGVADGFVSSAFLQDVAAPVVPTGAGTPSPAIDDAVHVPELIRQGTTAAGLKAARGTAAASLPGYPSNGCAAHLSALLQQAGIDVAMTWGAGKLAHVLADRGWSKVAVGGQKAGDVGVCFDNDPTPAGADHIYLVVDTFGPDEMMIADNQRTKDAPHTRFASGNGKTPTEYFLRAV
ncbi:glycoside hydrolase domain-containing protein [Pseudomonas putida]